jgi:hypothetical protein
VAGLAIREARAGQDEDPHRMATALERQAAASEHMARSLERMADQRR